VRTDIVPKITTLAAGLFTAGLFLTPFTASAVPAGPGAMPEGASIETVQFGPFGPRYGYRYGYGRRYGYGPRYGFGPRYGYGYRRFGYGRGYGYGYRRGPGYGYGRHFY
jgi:hypothetical protein